VVRTPVRSPPPRNHAPGTRRRNYSTPAANLLHFYNLLPDGSQAPDDALREIILSFSLTNASAGQDGPDEEGGQVCRRMNFIRFLQFHCFCSS